MRKIIALIISAVFLILSFSSCSVLEKDAQQLMGAPVHTGNNNLIIKSVEEYLGGDFSLLYPSEDEQSNAITVFGGGTDAAVLCKSGPKLLCLYLKQAETWQVINSVELSAEQILNSELKSFDAGEGLLVFYKNAEKTCLDVLIIDSEIKKDKTIECNFYLAADFDADKKDEITVFTDDKTQLYNTDTSASPLASLDYCVDTEKSNITAGKFFDDINAAFIDDSKNGEIKSQVIYLKNNEFVKAVASDDGISHYDEKIVSLDINSDGITEVPFVSLMPGYDSDEAVYFIDYKQYNSVEFESAVSGDFDFNNSYYINFPDKWKGSVTVKIDSANNTRTYLSYSEEQNKFGAELLKVGVYTKDEYTKIDKGNIIELSTQGDKVYVAKILNKLNKYAVDEAQVKEMFNLINRGDKK